MQVVIDIPKILYERVKKPPILGMYEEIIANGTPLPKGHGRLIDAEELKKIIRENDVLYMTGFCINLCDINSTPTIIEADKESEE